MRLAKELGHIRGQCTNKISKLARVRAVLQMLAIPIDIAQAEDFHAFDKS